MSVVTKRSAIILKKEDVEKEIKEEVTIGSKSYIYKVAGVFISMLQLSKIATKSIKVMVLSNLCLLPYSYFHLDQIPKNRSRR